MQLDSPTLKLLLFSSLFLISCPEFAKSNANSKYINVEREREAVQNEMSLKSLIYLWDKIAVKAASGIKAMC